MSGKSKSSHAYESWGRLLSDPFVIAVFCLLPYVVIYFSQLWKLPHYQFFPISIACTALLFWQRAKREHTISGVAKLLATFALLTAAITAWCAALFASAWIAYLAFLLLVAGTLSTWKDRYSDRNLSYLAIPLLVLWQPPYSPNVTGDGVLISRLQQVSAKVASLGLDSLGIIHDSPGTIIHCIGKSFGVEEACSGVQSFFLLVSCASILIAWHRRPFLHGSLLFIAAAYWAVLVNALRIAAIPVVHVALQFDLSHGLGHTLLGLCTMAMGLALLVSTDQCLLPLARFHLPALGQSPKTNMQLGWMLAIPFVPVFCLQAYDLYASLGRESKGIDFFAQSPLLELFPSDGPGQISDWVQQSYSHEDRIQGADFGERSDSWIYNAASGQVNISLDQAFPGWHELTVCYTNVGWRLTERRVEQMDGSDTVIARFLSQDGKHGYLLYSMCDRAGRFLSAPQAWTSLTALKARVQNRLTPSVRNSLFGSAAYQIQLFTSVVAPLEDDELEKLSQGFLECRSHLRDRVTSKTK